VGTGTHNNLTELFLEPSWRIAKIGDPCKHTPVVESGRIKKAQADWGQSGLVKKGDEEQMNFAHPKLRRIWF
jgi:hypothetical protein